MRAPSFGLIAVAVVLSIFSPSRARSQGSSDASADGLTPGSYVRFAYGSVNPINPQGSLRDWNRGQGVTLGYENWEIGSQAGVSRIGLGIELGYSTFPLNEANFLQDFPSGPNGTTVAASATKAAIFQVNLMTRLRIPVPYIMPSIGFGLGFLDWRPGKVRYSATAAEGTVTQQHRSGAALTLTGGLDKHIVDRFAIFADASYTYAYTSFGGGLSGSGSACLESDCDLLKNTQLGVIRGGARIRVGR